MRFFLAALLALGAVPGAYAQEVSKQLEEELQQQRRTQEQVRKAAEDAKKRNVSEPFEAVTYADVMKDPDNVELNFRYARTQVTKGDYLKAAATLERILMVNPELPRVRLFYASVLYRLDNLDDAERELKTLTKEQLTTTMREELEGYVAQIKRRRRKTRVGIALAAGFDFDENRNSAPYTGTSLAAEIPAILDTASTRRNDTAKTMTASLNVAHDLGYQEGHAIFASASYYRAEQTQLRTLNLQSYNGAVGGTFKSSVVDVTPVMSAGHILLAETTYQRSYGPSLRFDKRIGERANLFFTAGQQRQVYCRTQVVPTADQRTGDQFSGGIGISGALGRSASLTAAYTHTLQGAAAAYNAYRRESLNLSATRVMAKGRFALVSFTPQFDNYLAADPSITARIRQDHTYRAGLTFGTPLGFIAAPFDALLLSLSYEYFHARSNVPNYAYTNNKLSSTLTYRLDL